MNDKCLGRHWMLGGNYCELAKQSWYLNYLTSMTYYAGFFLKQDLLPYVGKLFSYYMLFFKWIEIGCELLSKCKVVSFMLLCVKNNNLLRSCKHQQLAQNEWIQPRCQCITLDHWMSRRYLCCAQSVCEDGEGGPPSAWILDWCVYKYFGKTVRWILKLCFIGFWVVFFIPKCPLTLNFGHKCLPLKWCLRKCV